MKQPRTRKLAFIIQNNKIYEKEFEFDFFGGFALSQKIKTINSFHTKILEQDFYEILEVSRKSENPLGNLLSAFNLMLTINNKSFPLECVYQSSKRFNGNVQFSECLYLSPLDAKRLIKLKVEEHKLAITSFNCFGLEFPLSPTTLFYDYIYVLALSQNPRIARQVLNYSCFTDIEFNHQKQFASQARSCAIFKYLHDKNLTSEALSNLQVFEKVYSNIIKDYDKQLNLLD